jgi:UDP-glucose 4-epimerase
MFALQHGESGDIFVRKSSAATVEDMAQALINIFNHSNGITITGIREGEKIHETLVTREELIKSDSYHDYFRVKNLERNNYEKFFTEGERVDPPLEGYTSENAQRMDLKDTTELILSLREIQEALGFVSVKGSQEALA